MYLCQEEWKDINGHVGLYQISNHGRIKSFAGNKDGIILSLKTRKQAGGYRWVYEGREFDAG